MLGPGILPGARDSAKLEFHRKQDGCLIAEQVRAGPFSLFRSIRIKGEHSCPFAAAAPLINNPEVDYDL